MYDLQLNIFCNFFLLRRRKHKLGDETEFFKAEIEISKEPYGEFLFKKFS